MDILFDDKIYLFERSGHLAILPTRYLEELSLRQNKLSLKQSAYYLKRYLEWCEKNAVAWDRADARDLMAFSQSIPESLVSHNRQIDRVCDFYRFAEHEGVQNPTVRFLIRGHQSYRSKRNLLHRRTKKVESIDPPEMAEIAKFIAAIKNPRNRLIAELMYESGMRISEVRHLKKDIVRSHAPKNRVVNCEVIGKGNKRRKVIIGEAIWIQLVDYAHFATGEYIFSADGIHPLSADAIEVAFQKASKISGIKIHPHLLRHAYASQWLTAVTYLTKKSAAIDTNLKVLQALLGHSSIHSTAIYLHTVSRAAAAKLRTDVQIRLGEKRGLIP